jgi:histidyl-tRNA synthetase
VFARVGASTDVVRKEMYDFVDRGGRRLALRPEGTAPVVRAYVEHRPTTPWKVWYLAPNFRAERPQAGRYRQHWQLGIEVIGVDDPDGDVEVIELLWGFYRELGLRDVQLLLNSMGDQESRDRYRTVLLEYWRAHADLIGDEMERAETNPLRILDSKRPDWQDMLERAPQLGEYLSAASEAHFARVQEGLQALGIAFEIAPRLVRGFDYYTSTVFEFASGALDSAQNAVGGGGRYDRLSEEMGGPAAPSIGFGSGIERLLLACDAEGVLPAPEARVDAFVVDLLGGNEALRLLAELREAGLAADRSYSSRKPKQQFAAADKSGAAWAVVLGAKEAERGLVSVKDLRSGEQVEVRREEVAAWLCTRKDETSP